MTALLDHLGRPMESAQSRRFRLARDRARRLLARYDAAQTTTDNERHWAAADDLSAAAAANPEVRRALRNRARYECQQNNSFGKGIILTLANDTIGVGPTLKMELDNEAANQKIEREFRRWSRAVRFARKLRTMRMSKAVDGEAFAMQTTNEGLATPVKLDLRLIEADQISDPAFTGLEKRKIDGVEFDADGNPIFYSLLRDHPGDITMFDGALKADRIPADKIIHFFREDRPDQRRGIPEVTPALPLFAQLRRYTLAVIAAAETAADLAGVIQSDAPPDGDAEDIEAMEALPIEMRTLLTLPGGWKLAQLKAEQPATTYEMFRNAILGEIGRCQNMPFNVAAGDSSRYNYASGRLDHQVYYRSLQVERDAFDVEVCDRALHWWFDEALFLPGYLPAGLPPIADLPHSWIWPGHEHVDPMKEANATVALWEAGHITDDDIQAKRGVDIEDHYRRLERQNARRREIGAPIPGETKQTIVSDQGGDDADA